MDSSHAPLLTLPQGKLGTSLAQEHLTQENSVSLSFPGTV